MKKSSPAEVLPTLGAAFENGYYAGRIRIDGVPYAIVVPPKAESEHEPVVWNKGLKRVAGAESFYDGLANTKAMAKAGSSIATWALDRKLYIPSRDELELLYRAFKPGAETNWCFRGDNPSSDPVGYAYSPKVPGQTKIQAFRAGAAEAFEKNWYWSSTQYAGDGDYAWLQHFSHGNQGSDHEGSDFRVRAVRRIKL
jgi:hypothetical protein